jgi:hypothetical protein
MLVHSCETCTSSRAAHKESEILILEQNMCQQHQFCIFACIGRVFRKTEIYYMSIRTFIIRNTFNNIKIIKNDLKRNNKAESVEIDTAVVPWDGVIDFVCF